MHFATIVAGANSATPSSPLALPLILVFTPQVIRAGFGTHARQLQVCPSQEQTIRNFEKRRPRAHGTKMSDL